MIDSRQWGEGRQNLNSVETHKLASKILMSSLQFPPFLSGPLTVIQGWFWLQTSCCTTCIISDLMSTTMKKRQQGRVGLFKETETTPSAEGNLRCDCHGNDFLMQVGGSRGFCCVSSQSSDATGQLEA